MIKFLVSSCKLQRLSLESSSCKVLTRSGILGILPTTFEHMKILRLSIKKGHVDGFLCGFGMICSCLNLEELKISVDHECHAPVELDAFNYDPKYTFSSLRTIYVEIKDIRDVGIELKLISCLLASSPTLERLSFSCDYRTNDAKKSELRRKILQFNKASAKAKVVVSSDR